ncbi:hypothetical protein Kpho02_03430 [Kitasatospora phosalacinea]|uniref:Uncharacterized protein n=1 Tax=Kitasatospora phosalacinea TaxID=2065 RepID=A0A9W6UY37_9ACTN|nr:hypothetical protein Kpho02_03430 [Kitasatospora phosalacinea]
MAAVPPSVANRSSCPSGGPPVHEFVLQVAGDDLLGAGQHPVGDGVVVADGGVREFVQEGVAVEVEAVDGEAGAGGEQVDAGQFGVGAGELVVAGGDAVLFGHAAEVVGGPDPAGLGEGEVAEGEHGLAGAGADPVGVAAARVEHVDGGLVLLPGPVGLVVLGEPDELALELERAEPGEALDLLAADRRLAHGALLSGGGRTVQPSRATMIAPQMVSRTFPAAYGMV